MEGNTCGSCGYFHQHYVMDSQTCTAICCGHCSYPRLKHRKPDTPACKYFVPGERELPVGRQFLTLELLRWVQSLEFPPEIREMEQEGGSI